MEGPLRRRGHAPSPLLRSFCQYGLLHLGHLTGILACLGTQPCPHLLQERVGIVRSWEGSEVVSAINHTLVGRPGLEPGRGSDWPFAVSHGSQLLCLPIPPPPEGRLS